MATTTATLTLTSDVMPGAALSLSKTMTMHKLGVSTGLEEATGLSAKSFSATSAVAIIEEDEYTDTKASKIYMRNTGSSATTFFYVAKHASAAAADTTETIGRLYGCDWMLIPYDGATNITVAPSTTETMTLEYMVFVEN